MTRNSAIIFNARETFERRAYLRAFEESLERLAREAGDYIVSECPVIAGRRFRWDYALPKHRIGIEIIGFFRGGHHGFGGTSSDCEKMSLAAIVGWRIVMATHRQIREGKALNWARRALAWRALNDLQKAVISK